MAVRISGLNSGLDTDAIVQELVSAYATKKESYEKKQTKLSWTMDAWKDVNTKVYGFYTSTLSSMRYSSSYNLRNASITNSSVAQVSASAGAVTSNQTLAVKQLAASAYYTSGQVTKESGDSAKVSTTLAEIGITEGTIMLNDKEINLSGDMTLGKLTAELKNAGVTASFDDSTGRFFISAKTSGADYEFTLTAGDANGLDALTKMGLLSFEDINGEETAELKRYREMAAAGYDNTAEIEERYNASKWTTESYRKSISSKVDNAKNAIETLNKNNTKLQEQLDAMNADDYDWSAKYDTEEAYNEAKADLQSKIDANNEKIATNQTTIDEYQPYLEDDTLLAEKVDALNAEILSDIQSDVSDEISIAQEIVNKYDNGLLINSADSARITAKDSIIKLNGATFTSNTNSYSINGLNINATATTVTTSVDANGNVVENDNAVSIGITVDTQGIYDKIKSMFSAYNEMISYIDGMYYADDADGYEPLTDTEKEQMTDKQIEDWEEKIKESLLRRDSTLGSLTSAMKSALLGTSMEINGKTYSLSTFGISTGSYFSTASDKRGQFHIDGDKDDSVSGTNADKLMAAISADPDSVIEYFQKLSQNLYTTLSNKMASSGVSSAFTIYNDKQMASQYSDYQTKINDWEERLENYEESYHKKFSAMEKALAELQSKQNSLASLLGG